MFITSHSGECDVAGRCFGGVVGVVVVAVEVGELMLFILVLVPPPTIESIENPILGLDGTATIGVGARGIIVFVYTRFVFLFFSSLSIYREKIFSNKLTLK